MLLGPRPLCMRETLYLANAVGISTDAAEMQAFEVAHVGRDGEGIVEANPHNLVRRGMGALEASEGEDFSSASCRG
ncbi:hypothetical protein GOP47_0013191 [Adiantum capillus-veneris]|uniref:Uncharacterized protein n=1 Tax=Adiantum capillus-veneris TaxID=13818 RepID=A0A9D4UN98_ADICA|nr:hypothetical protein GOP47_0013191 [Adiantum capillus-veneris]